MQALFAVLYSPALELVVLVITLAIGTVLALGVYRSDPASATSKLYALLTLSTFLWLANNYATAHLAHLPGIVPYALLMGRMGILFAAGMSALLLLLAHTIPSRTLRMSTRSFLIVCGLTAIMMLLNLSPFAFVSVSIGESVSYAPGPGLMPFSIISTIFSLLAIHFLVKRYRAALGEERSQLRLVLTGMFSMLGLILLTILIPVVAFNSLVFLPFTPLYVLIFLGLTAYAIATYHLFNIKVLVTEAVTIVMLIVLFAKLFGDASVSAQVLDALVLICMIIFSYFLVRSVRREVEQRELIEAQERELEVANQKQETLLHFISHEIKGYLTKNQAVFAAIVGGDFGQTSPELAQFSQMALDDTRKGVDTVMDILDASNLKRGTVAYDKKEFDVAAALAGIVADLSIDAKAKGIELLYHPPVTGACLFTGDENKLKRHVFRNIIDNSIKYTPKGSVTVDLTRNESRIRLVVSDTGVGITKDDMARLFTEGGHGKESIKVNVHSTGYGLFIAKQVVEAHGGSIKAESDGAGKGSRFIVELPLRA